MARHLTHGQPPSTWFFYFVAAALGVSFSIALLMLAWGSVVENESRKFAFASLTSDDAVRSNIRTAHGTLEAIASFLGAVPNVDVAGFRAYTTDLLRDHGFVSAVIWYRADQRGDGLQLVGTSAQGQDAQLAQTISLNGTQGYKQDLRTALRSDAVLPLALEQNLLPTRDYVLVRRIVNKHAGEESTRDGIGAVIMLISPEKLVGEMSSDSGSAMSVYSESEGIGGRQLLYRKLPPAAQSHLTLKKLEQSSQVRFEQYSIRLIADKSLSWADVDKGLIGTALILGVGVTLLLVALARAKELQARDLTARNLVIEEQVKRQTHELAEARDQALEASRVKSDFLASMSHEIRTPLNAIIGMAELLAETTLSTDQEKYVSVFKHAGAALLSLVNDILDFSKIEAGQLILEEIDFNLREIVEQSADIYALKTAAKGLELVVQIAPEIPAQVNGDPSRLRQVILNLIGNAIKFTERGEIVVKLELVGHERQVTRIRCSVADTGIGIPADKQEAIFSSFTQVDSSTTRRYGGTGLGLTISRKLVELMSGRIWVDSTEGRGSTFVFEIACKPATSPALPLRPVDLSRVSILVVDDNATNRLILREILNTQGAQVTEAGSGQEAIARYRERLAAGKPFDLVLCDVQMPELDGFGVFESLLKAGGAVSSVMMLSSSNLAGEVERAKALGLSGFLVKPVKRADLFNAIAMALQRAPATVAANAAAAPSSNEMPRASILLVEDNTDNRLLIKAYLKGEPVDIDEAEHGAEAVAKFSDHRYDLILMDIQMPILDGHEATRAIRAMEQASGRPPVPIIALTAHAIKEDMEKSLAAGCSAHLTKPIKKQTLLTALATYLPAVH